MTALLEARGVVKRFGHVTALSGADFTVDAGEVVALIGDNGAGKSTLVKVLVGLVRPDDGEVRIDGTRSRCTARAMRSAFRRSTFMPHTGSVAP